jgi:hypothetical protein
MISFKMLKVGDTSGKEIVFLANLELRDLIWHK